MQVKLAESDADVERIAGVMLELRTAFDRADLVAQMRGQRAEGYQLAWVEADGEVLCVAGFVVGRKLAWGKHIYVDDLVTAARHRSTGAGRTMVEWLRSHAKALGCRELHLDSGVQRFDAHRFYLRERFNIDSHHFSTRELG